MSPRLLQLASILLVAAAPAFAAQTPAYDFDGDGKSDISVFHREAGDWYIRQSQTDSLRLLNWGWSELTPVPGDYDGDGKVDVAVYHRRTGDWFILLSQTGALRVQNWGWFEATPVQADYDGDGKTDVAVFHRKTGNWYIQLSTTGTLWLRNWGWSASRPVPADYDGDDTDDICVYHPDSGTWYILQSSNGALRTESLGWAEARPVCGKFDADNRADPAVYHPPSGNWHILESTTGQVRIQNWGWSAAGPVPADYDGDGRTDIAVYHHAKGNWYIRHSQSGAFILQNWGWSASRAVPSYAKGSAENIRTHHHGDSITYGRGSSSDGPATGYPILVEKKAEASHGGDFTAFNFGEPGETTSEGLQRLLANLIQTDSKVLFLMEGTNDMFNNTAFSVVERNLRNMVAIGQSRGMLVVIATIPPVITNEYRDRSAQQQRTISFNPRIYNIARDYHIPVAPVFEAITAVPGWEQLLMDQESANHPNDLGYQVVRDTFLNALIPYLNNGTIW